MERRSIRSLRMENQARTVAGEGTSAHSQDWREIKLTEIATSNAQLRLENNDLLKLRSDISQLRQKRREFDNLQRETKQLSVAVDGLKRSSNQVAVRQSDNPFISGSHYVLAGFATPEQAVQSIFWALRHKDAAAMLRCLPPEIATDWSDNTAYVQHRFEHYFARFVDGYQIIAARSISRDELLLRVRSSSGAESAIPLKAVAGEWKLKNIHGF
jgi:hypothetical protein